MLYAMRNPCWPQLNQVSSQMNKCIPEVGKAVRVCVQETGPAKLFPASVMTDNLAETMARGKAGSQPKVRIASSEAAVPK